MNGRFSGYVIANAGLRPVRKFNLICQEASVFGCQKKNKTGLDT